MRYSRVFIDAIGYELPPLVVSTKELESRLQPLYKRLRLPEGQLEAWTGISERRWWAKDFSVSDGALSAARSALARCSVTPSDLDVVIYAGVCREQFEPATACRVAAGLGVSPDAAVYDISNACLGVLNGIVDIANRIELGQCRAGLVVSCETAREINEAMIEQMLRVPNMDTFKNALATLTGGSGAVGVVVTDGTFDFKARRQLIGGVTQNDTRHHGLCRWGLQSLPGVVSHVWNSEAAAIPRSLMDFGLKHCVMPFMSTDAISVLRYGVDLGLKTWRNFMHKLGWAVDQVDRVICHQVGASHRDSVLRTLGIAPEKDFSTFPFLGNIGTVSLPLTAALAEERQFLRPGDQVGFLGIGSGLNCMMLGSQMVMVPAEFRGRFLDIDGFSMHYRDEGAGNPVVCLHGNPTWSFMYRDVIKALRPSHRVLAPDHIGCGLSAKPNRGKYPYTLSRRIADFGRFVDALLPSTKISLIVHDWGGMIGLAWATQHPDRIEKLVVMNTAAFRMPADKPLPGALKIGRMPVIGPILIQGLNMFCRGAADHCVVRQPLSPAVRALYLSPYDSWANRIAVERFVATIPVSPADEGYDIVQQTEAGLPRLADKKTLVLWGLRDFVFDADYLAQWRVFFPRATVHSVADAGHYLLEDAGDELIPHLSRFLAA